MKFMIKSIFNEPIKYLSHISMQSKTQDTKQAINHSIMQQIKIDITSDST